MFFPSADQKGFLAAFVPANNRNWSEPSGRKVRPLPKRLTARVWPSGDNAIKLVVLKSGSGIDRCKAGPEPVRGSRNKDRPPIQPSPVARTRPAATHATRRSEEHTSQLQSLRH